MNEQVDQKQRMLKFIVIGLGIALIICAAIVFVTIARRAAGLGEDTPPPVPPPAKILGNVDVPLPYGAKAVSVSGAGREIYLLLDMPEGRQVMIVDRVTGDVLGNLRLMPGAASGGIGAPDMPAAAPPAPTP
jgi:hypothetical protein